MTIQQLLAEIEKLSPHDRKNLVDLIQELD